MSGFDYKVMRYSKLFIDAAPTPLLTDETYLAAMNGKNILRVGGGIQAIATGWGTQENIGYGWLSGGLNKVDSVGSGTATATINGISGSYKQFTTVITLNTIEDAPLEIGTLGGDSGSPVFTWNTNNNRFELLGANQAGGGTGAGYGKTSYIRSAPAWSAAISASYDAPTVSDAAGAIVTIGATDAAGAGTLTQGASSWAFTGLANGLANASATTAQLEATRNIVFNGAGNTLQLADSVDLGAGTMSFSGGGTYTLDDGGNTALTLNSAGYIVNGSTTLVSNLTGSIGDDWRKIGTGTFRIQGTGDNPVKLSLGEGLVELNRTGGFAVDNILLVSGRGTVRLVGSNQIAGTVAFGRRGGILDLFGHDTSWSDIVHMDAGARITNTANGNATTFTFTGSGTQAYLGAFMDDGSLAAGQLNVAYAPSTPAGSTWTVSGVNSNSGSWTVSAGELKVEGTPTLHANNYVDPNDWQIAQFSTGTVSVSAGAKFTVGQYATVTSSVSVADTGIFRIQGDHNSFSGAVSLTGTTATLNTDIGGANSLALASVVSGTGRLTKDGTGTLTLSNSGNTFSGANVINSGTVRAPALAALGTGSANWTVNSPGVIGVNDATAAAVKAKLTTGSAGTLALIQTGVTRPDDAPNLSGYTNLFLGAIGTTEVGAPGTTNTLMGWNSTGGWNLGGGGGTLVMNLKLAGTGTLNIGNGDNTGVVHLTNTGNTFSGGIVVKDGVSLTYSSLAALGGSSVSVNYGSTFDLGATPASALTKVNSASAGVLLLTGTDANAYDLSGLSAAAFGANGTGTYSGTLAPGAAGYRFGGAGDLTVASTLSGANAVTIDGQNRAASSVTLSGSNSFTGALTIRGYDASKLPGGEPLVGSTTLKLGSASAINSASSVTLFTGATLDLNGYNATLTAFSGSGGTLSNSAATAATATIANSSAATVSGTITNATGALNLVKSGAGALTLSGANTYSGSTAINAGAIILGHASALGSGAVTINSGGALDLAGYTPASANTITLAGTGDGTRHALHNSGAGSYVTLGTIALTSAATVGGAGSSTIIATPGIALNGNTLTATNIRLNLGEGGITAGDIIGGSASKFYISGSQSGTGGAGTWTIGAGSEFAVRDFNNSAVTARKTISLNGGSVTNGNLDNGGGAQSTIYNDITVGASGGTIIGNNAWGLYLQHAGVLSGSGAINATNWGGVQFLGDVSGYTGTLTIASGSRLGFNGALNQTFNGVLTGAGRLEKNGATTTILAQNSSYTGTSTLNAGTLQLGTGGTTGSLGTNTGTITNNGTLAFNRSNALTLANVISGAGGVSQLGTGTTTLTGANTYSGTTSVSAGTLQIGAGATAGALGTGAVTVSGSGTLAFSRSDAVTLANHISGSGNFAKLGSNNLTVTGNFIHTGSTSIAGGSLILDQATNATVASAITGAGALVKNGSNTLTLSGASSYTGATVLNAGTTVVTGALGNTAVSVASGATLSGSGSIAGIVTVANGATLRNTQGSTLTMGGLTLGATSVIEADLATLNGATLFQVNGDLALNGSVTLVTPLSLSGDYRLINYTGTLSGSGLTLNNGTPLLSVVTGVAGQVSINNLGQARIYWDGTSTIANNAIEGGSGTWTTTGTNWTDAVGSSNGAMAPAPGFAIFKAAAGTVTIDNTPAQVQATGFQFATTGYTITGGALELINDTNGYASLRVGDGTAAGATMSATVSAALTGAAAVHKTDLGTLILTGTNTYSGTTTIDAGTLQIGSGGTTGTLGAGAVVNNAALVFNRSNALTVSGAISGSGSLTQAGTGSLTLTGANTYSGTTTISAGSLIIGSGGSLGSGAVINHGSLNFASTSAITVAGAISGTGSFTHSGTGTTTLTGANSYSGVTTVSAGTLQIGSGSTSGSLGSGAITLTGGTLRLNRSDATVLENTISSAGTLSLAGSGDTTLTGAIANSGTISVASTATGTTEFAGIISGSGSFTRTGTGTTLFTANNTYSGTTTLSAGKLQVGVAGGTGTLGSGSVSISAGATLDIKRSGSVAIANTITNSGVLTFTGSASTSVSGGISGAGSLTQSGTGTTTLSGAKSYTGATSVTDGRLVLTSGTSLATSGITVSSGAGFGGAGTYASTTNGSLNYAAGSVILATKTGLLQLSQTPTFASSGGSILVDFIDSPNVGTTYTVMQSNKSGAFSTSNLKLALRGTLATAAGSGSARSKLNATVSSINQSIKWTGATDANWGVNDKTAGSENFILSGTSTKSNFYSFDTVTLDDTANAARTSITLATSTNASAVTFNNSTLSYTLSGSGGFVGSGTLTKSGTGTVILAIDNANSGIVTLNDGTLQLGNGGTTGSLGSGIVSLSGGSTLQINRSNTYTLANDLVGTGSVVQSGTGTTLLSGSNTAFNGSLIVSAGTLRLDASSALTGGAALTVNSGATFDANAFDFTVSALTGAGFVNIASVNATIGGATDSTFSGNLAGASGSVTKTGTGTLTLSGTGTYTGLTSVSAGTLRLGSLAAFNGQGAMTIASGATFDANGYNFTTSSLTGSGALNIGAATATINTSGSDTFSGVISGTGSLVKSGAGTLTLSGANTYTGLTSVSAGTLKLASSGAFGGAAALTVASGATFDANGYNFTTSSLNGAGTLALGAATATVNTAGADTFSGVISGSGSLVKSGAGTLTLAGDNTYTGTTTISAGTLALASGGDLGSGAVINNAALALTGMSGTLANAISGTGSLTQSGTGSATLSGANTYTGVTTVSTGTLRLGSASAFGGQGALAIASGATFDANGYDFTTSSLSGAGSLVLAAATVTVNDTGTDTFSGVISGAGSLVKSGAGTLVLTGANTYSGTTTINTGILRLEGASLASASLVNNAALELNEAGTLALTSSISGTGTLTHTGTGVATLSGVNSHTGATTVSSGTLALGSSFAFGGQGSLAIASGATFNAAGYNFTTSSLTGSGTLALGAGNATVNLASGSATFDGIISGTGGLTKSGAGTFVLNGANTYSGTTALSGGTLQVGTGGTTGNLGTGSVSISSGASLDFNRSDAVTYAGVISGSGSLTQSGTGTLTLSGTNTFSGSTAVNAGTLRIGADANLGTSSLSINGGTLKTSAAFTLAATHGTTLGSAGATLDSTALTTGQTFTINPVITGTGPLTIRSNGDTSDSGGGAGGLGIDLRGANTFTGDITVTSGLVSYLSDSAFGTASNLIILNGGGLLDSNRNLTLTHAIRVDAAGGTIRTYGATTANLNGALTGSGTLRRTDGGTLNLGGDLSGFSGTFDNRAGSTFLTGSGTVGGAWNINAGTFGFNSSGNHTLAGIISGTGALAKSGTGTATLTGVNTYTGATTINAGTLRIGGSGQLNSGTYAGAITNNGTFDYASSASQTISGVISGTGAMLKSGAGTLTLSGANTYTGNLAVTTGTLAVNTIANNASPVASALGNMTTAGRTITVGSGATLRFDARDAIGQYNYASPVTLIADGGTITRVSNTTTFNAIGALELKNGGRLTSTNGNSATVGSLALNGTVTVSGTSGSFIDTLAGQTTNSYLNLGTVGGATTFNIGSTGDATADLTVSAVLGDKVLGGAGGLTKSGSGTLLLTAVNTFTGATTINAGTLRIGGAGQLAAGTYAGAITNSGTLDHASSANQTLSGIISGSGSLVKSGSGTLDLSAVNTYTGATAINAGTLRVSGAGQLASGTYAAAITNAGTFDHASSAAQTLSGVISGSGSLLKSGTGTLSLSAQNTYTGGTTVNAGILNLSGGGGASGTIRGTATVNSGATLRLSTGDATGYNGGASALTAINLVGGTLDINTTSNQTLGSATVTMTGGAITGIANSNLDFFGGASALTTLASASSATVAGTKINLRQNNGVTFTVADGSAASDLIINSVVSSSAGFTNNAFIKSGAGLLQLNGVNTYSVNTTINAGTLRIGGAGQLGSGTYAGTIANTGTFDYASSANQTFSGVISGTGSFTQSGTGTSTLTGVNTYTGATTINAGTLRIGGAGQLNSGTYAGAIANAGTFDYASSAAQTLSGVISGTGTLVKSGSGTLTLSAANTYSGATTVSAGTLNINNQLRNSSGITVGTGATTNLNATNMFVGGHGIALADTQVLTLNGGTLTFSSGMETRIGNVNLNDGATLTSNRALSSYDILIANTASGAATVAVGGTGTSTINGTGGFHLQGPQNFSVASGAALQVSAVLANAGTTGGALGAVVKAGTGTMTLSATNTYTGGTTINAGTVVAGANNALGTGAVTINSGGTFNTGLAGTAWSLANAVTLNSGGTLKGVGTLTQALTVNSGAVVGPGNSPGILTLGNGGSFATGSAYEWEFAGNTLTAPGTDYDLLRVTGGTLTVNSGVTFKFIASGVDYTGTAWDVDRTFTMIDATGTGTVAFTSGTLDTSAAGDFAAQGAWSVQSSSGDIIAKWTAAIPEPHEYGLMGAGALLALRAVSRRRRRA